MGPLLSLFGCPKLTCRAAEPPPGRWPSPHSCITVALGRSAGPCAGAALSHNRLLHSRDCTVHAWQTPNSWSAQHSSLGWKGCSAVPHVDTGKASANQSRSHLVAEVQQAKLLPAAVPGMRCSSLRDCRLIARPFGQWRVDRHCWLPAASRPVPNRRRPAPAVPPEDGLPSRELVGLPLPYGVASSRAAMHGLCPYPATSDAAHLAVASVHELMSGSTSLGCVNLPLKSCCAWSCYE